jgi:pSer/pThr/pTyr-binding forkhead associated (FHA) protein
VTVLFVVNGSPYGAGRLVGNAFTFLEIREFFAAYARQPQSPLSFLVTDKRLLLGLMVLFRYRPTLQFRTDLVEMDESLKKIAARGNDAILGIRSGDDWAVSICTRGKPVANYFPVAGDDAMKGRPPEEQLLAYVQARSPGGVTVDLYEETRVNPAADAVLVTPETRGRLSQVFLRAEATVKEEVAASPPAQEALAAAPEAAPAPTQAPPVAPAPAAPPAPPVARGPIPEVLLFFGEKQLGTFPLTKGELTIGRNPGNDILIDNVGVSRQHAVIRVSGERVVIEDLGSANGTFVNGQKIAMRDLQSGDEILLVKHRLVYRVPKETAAVPAAVAADVGQQTMYIDPAGVAPMAGKLAAKAESATSKLRPRLILPDLKKFALGTEEVTLGSGPDCQIQLSGVFVARAHAKIVPEKESQFKIVHLGGLAGTRVNGEKITEHLLKHGDEIEIGKQKLLFRLER